jgi:hypothetical protein
MRAGVERAFSGGGAELFFQLGQFGVSILLKSLTDKLNEAHAVWAAEYLRGYDE